MTKKTAVILPGNGNGEFRRTMRTKDEDGNPVVMNDKAGNPRVLKFQPGQPVELDAEELEAVRDDIGVVLHIAKAEQTKDSKLIGKPDSKATAAFVEETRKMRASEAGEAKARKSGKRAEPAKPSSTAHSAASHKDIEHKAK